MDDYRCWNKHGEEGLNEAEMRDSHLEREVPTDIEEDHDNVNEANILGFTDGDIEFQVLNIKEMVHNVERHDDYDQYSNGELAKYKKIIEDCHTRFLCQNEVLIVCMTQDQLFNTYGQKCS
jgi:hypothetical protein